MSDKISVQSLGGLEELISRCHPEPEFSRIAAFPQKAARFAYNVCATSRRFGLQGLQAMCGIAGFVESRPTGAAGLEARARRMADQLVHRGPDDSGLWTDPAVGLGLGFRRLSILDLSPAGHQPMCSASGRYVIVFNGEVYNFSELRGSLEPRGHTFRGHSDTEVMLAAVEEWGLEAAVRRFVGMFAFALWDRRDRTLHLVRDRLGIKPLYYGFSHGTLLFASELKAIRAHPDFKPEIDRSALTLLVRHGYVPTPYSIYCGVSKLTPGSIISFRIDGGKDPALARSRPYWSFREFAEQGEREPFPGSDEEACSELERLLKDAVGLRMIADVPLGAFLSGGIDSSTVVALMQAQSTSQVKTFTIGFEERRYDEAAYARQVAAHLGTDHTELYVAPEEARSVIPKLPALFDEPFADSSQIPTYLVSRLARQKVTVSLSGDGGDELFGGYTHYTRAPWLWSRMRRIPGPLRQALAVIISTPGVGAYNRLLGRKQMASEHSRPGTAGEKIHKLAEALAVRDAWELHRHFSSHWKRPARLVIGGQEPLTIFTDPSRRPPLSGVASRMLATDTLGYLPDDILTKVDRASMAVSLEARVPILDHRVVEFAARLPMRLKIRQGQGKWILRRVLHRYVPAALIERPKMGFSLPLGAWLREPLRDWAEALLAGDRLRREGYFRPQPVRKAWAEHLSGDRNAEDLLWDVLMFQSWLEHWR
jgi:asparagine synthase (glutamine-hydrolysing)